jgi:hypothetical protein
MKGNLVGLVLFSCFLFTLASNGFLSNEDGFLVYLEGNSCFKLYDITKPENPDSNNDVIHTTKKFLDHLKRKLDLTFGLKNSCTTPQSPKNLQIIVENWYMNDELPNPEKLELNSQWADSWSGYPENEEFFALSFKLVQDKLFITINSDSGVESWIMPSQIYFFQIIHFGKSSKDIQSLTEPVLYLQGETPQRNKETQETLISKTGPDCFKIKKIALAEPSYSQQEIITHKEADFIFEKFGDRENVIFRIKNICNTSQPLNTLKIAIDWTVNGKNPETYGYLNFDFYPDLFKENFGVFSPADSQGSQLIAVEQSKNFNFPPGKNINFIIRLRLYNNEDIEYKSTINNLRVLSN